MRNTVSSTKLTSDTVAKEHQTKPVPQYRCRRPLLLIILPLQDWCNLCTRAACLWCCTTAASPWPHTIPHCCETPPPQHRRKPLPMHGCCKLCPFSNATWLPRPVLSVCEMAKTSGKVVSKRAPEETE